MVVFKCLGNLKDMVVKVILDNLLFNGDFKICLDIWCFLCMYSIILGCIYKILSIMFCCIDNCKNCVIKMIKIREKN